MSGVSWEEEMRANQPGEDETRDADSRVASAGPEVETSAWSQSVAHSEYPTDIEFNIDDRGSLQSYMSDLVGELTAEAPAQRDIHNLTLRFSSPSRAAPAEILERLASFMKLAGEALGAELGAAREGGQIVRSPRGTRDPSPQAGPASPPPSNKPSPAGLHAVFSTVPRT